MKPIKTSRSPVRQDDQLNQVFGDLVIEAVLPHTRECPCGTAEIVLVLAGEGLEHLREEWRAV